MTNLQRLEATGKTLYGEQWQAALARDLDVAIRSVQRWVTGGRDCPDLSAELVPLLIKRRAEIDQLLTKLSIG